LSSLSAQANTVESLGVSSATLVSDLGSVGPAGFSLGITAGAPGSSGYLFMSEADGGTGTPTQAGSTAPTSQSTSTVKSAGGIANTIGGTGTAGSGGVVASSVATSFTAAVAKDYQTDGTGASSIYSTLYGLSGNSGTPMQLLGASDKITLDLWAISGKSSGQTVQGATLASDTWTYEGDIVVDLTGTTATYDYDPMSAVPEPSTYGIIAGAGLLILCLGNQLRRKTA
jgi:hypothetical protein